jgi:hypothetical protein
VLTVYAYPSSTWGFGSSACFGKGRKGMMTLLEQEIHIGVNIEGGNSAIIGNELLCFISSKLDMA